MSGSSILSGFKSVPSIDTLKRLYCPLVRVLKANSLGRSMILLAGNDNPDLIKDFKFLLMKLMTNGRIPRREGHDILSDLASLGY